MCRYYPRAPGSNLLIERMKMNFIIVGIIVTATSFFLMRAEDHLVIYLGMAAFVTGLYLVKTGRRKMILKQGYSEFLSK
jgi:hypothetical protein